MPPVRCSRVDRILVGILWAVALASFAAPVRAQLVSAPDAPRLSLGISAGAPGSETEVQLKLAGPPDMDVGRIEAVISVPAVLEFKEVGGSMIAAELVKARTKVGPAKDGLTELAISLESGSSERSLPAAVLANVSFTVRREAKPGVLNLGLRATAFARDGRDLGALESFEGRINIQEPDVFYSCFFYMH
jgi:hypothetical protein